MHQRIATLLLSFLTFVAFGSVSAHAQSFPPAFGTSLAVHEDLVLVSAPNVKEEVGEAFLFHHQDGEHRLLRTFQSHRWGRNQFGGAVAVGKDFMAVSDTSAPIAGLNDAGAVYVFAREKNGEFAKRPRQLASDKPERLASLGSPLAIVGDMLATAAVAQDAGAILVFKHKDGAWKQEATLSAPDDEKFTGFGSSLAMDDATIVVGAYAAGTDGDTPHGAAYVYERDKSGKFAPGRALSWGAADGVQLFGVDVALSKELLVVGASGTMIDGKENVGAVFVYQRGIDGRIPEKSTAMPTAPRGKAEDQFGTCVALWGKRIVVSSPYSNDDAGAVYIFAPAGVGKWEAVEKLAGSGANARFGHALAANSERLYIGEPNPFPMSGKNGSVQVFELEGEKIVRKNAIEYPRAK